MSVSFFIYGVNSKSRTSGRPSFTCLSHWRNEPRSVTVFPSAAFFLQFFESRIILSKTNSYTFNRKRFRYIHVPVVRVTLDNHIVGGNGYCKPVFLIRVRAELACNRDGLIGFLAVWSSPILAAREPCRAARRRL
jgi:hypothetical protein